MDDEDFHKFLKKSKKSENAIKQIMALVTDFEEFLSEEGHELSDARISDMDDFVFWIEDVAKKKANKQLWALAIYYRYLEKDEMAKPASSLRGKKIKRKPFPIGGFRGVNEDYVKQLENIGIIHVDQMIQRGKTPEARKKIAEESGVPIESILEFV
ncbi:MAG: DUF4332 domain-containing protein, partial [Candidatus Thorarchaeota archaeon]